MHMEMPLVDQREGVAVSHAKGIKHRFYEDAFRMLSRDIPLVKQRMRGEVFAVFDGIGSAPEGRHSAQVMADALLRFYREPVSFEPSVQGIARLLTETNMEINSWGSMAGTVTPLGGCAGTVVWLYAATLHVFHAGDTSAVLIRDRSVKELTQAHQMDDGAIFKYFGMGEAFCMDADSFEIEEGDRILMMSDGVTKQFEPVEAGNKVVEPVPIQGAVQELVRQCQLAGGTDDITAMLIEVEEIWEENDN